MQIDSLVRKLLMEIELSPEERAYLRKILKEHLDYYRLLAGNLNASKEKRQKRDMLEALERKLAGTD